MNYPICDANERKQALNPDESFIVQAPAGSGKTELLTQRFLVLLASVTDPEAILAITFTKKSAAEMRARIIHALNKAKLPEPVPLYAKETWRLAKKVLQRSDDLQWNLLNYPNRLRIQTIDSFNTYLTQQLPILSTFGVTPAITDAPSVLYRHAIDRLFSELEKKASYPNEVNQLLLHMDNDLNKLAQLLMNLLAKRDQWLPYITVNANDPELREKLEKHLCTVNIDILTTLYNAFPKDQINEFLCLMRFAAEKLREAGEKAPLIQCIDLQTLPGTTIDDKPLWLALSDLLLTKEFTWRKQLNKSIGFPSPSQSKNPHEKTLLQHMKQRMMTCLESFSSNEALRMAFQTLHSSPPHYYEEDQWKTLHALHSILCMAVKELRLAFKHYKKMDFIENAEAALAALSTMNHSIQESISLKHLLIDEFQDTSNSQFRLIEKLIEDWKTGDGRTLFLVGDPMQSIYRFREAEVGLFIRAYERGIGSVRLTPLALSVNFRSSPSIIHWINQHFKYVFPSFNDIGMGAVSYSPSVPPSELSHQEESVHLHSFIETDDEDEDEVKQLVKLIEITKEEHPTDTIAILVRSRTHLKSIIPALNQANIAYRAIQIDPLHTRPVIQDLMALTRALLHLADRIAWFSILRAPWCGLTLEDLLILGSNHTTTLWEQLHNPVLLEKLSIDGKKRMDRILPILECHIHHRDRFALHTWIESAWLELGGPASVKEARDLEDASAYFLLLQTLHHENIDIDPDDLNARVSQLFASPLVDATNPVQIMTIHKSKGLEFDTVILPYLDRKSPSHNKSLLLWMERPQKNDTNALLLAPIHPVNQDSDAIYDYIKKQHTIKEDFEMGRLLYVAATRTKKRLHAFFSLKAKQQTIIAPSSKSLLHKLWSSIQANISYTHSTAPNPEASLTDIMPKNKRFIDRLVSNWENPLPSAFPIKKNVTYPSSFLLADNEAKQIGIVVHQLLQHIAQLGTAWWEKTASVHRHRYLKHQFIQQGMLTRQIEHAIEQSITAISQTLHDPRGQWILHPHSDAKTEYPLTAVIDHEVHSLIIDRTFIEHDIRWIIDYKTAVPINEEKDDFLKSQQKKYALMMAHYAKAFRDIEAKPIQCGLYFPLVPAWCEWKFL